MSIRELRFNCAGDPGDDIPILQPDRPDGTPPISCSFETPGRLLALIPDTSTGGAWLTYQGGTKRFRIILPPLDVQFQAEAGEPPQLPPEYAGDPDKVALHYTQVSATLQPLEISGRFFRKNGERFFLNGASAFGAIARLYEGGEAPIRDLFKQRQDLGFNSARLWTAIDNSSIMRMIPREHPSFYQDVATISNIAAEYGQYPYWTVYAGANAETLGDQGAMVAHQLQMQDALAPLGFCLLDLHNEFDNSPNNASAFIGPTPPSTILWSQGSNSQDVDPPTPYGRFCARHPGSGEWQRKVGKQGWDFQEGHNINFPEVDDETVRVEPVGEMNLEHCFDAGATGALFIAGAFFHSREAKLGIPWRDELDQATSWCRGVQSIIDQGLEVAQDGSYSRPDDPNFMRVYVKTLGGRSIRHQVRN